MRSLIQSAIALIECALLCGLLLGGEPEQGPPWESLRRVPMQGDLRIFWNVSSGERQYNDQQAALHGFSPVTLLSTYSDYPGKQKENVSDYLKAHHDNPWKKPDSVYYMAANVEENYLRTRRYGDKPVYAYVWLRYHNSNKQLVGQELAPYLAEAAAVVPYFSGAKGVVVWGSERKSKGQPYRNLPIFLDSVGRVSELSALISQAKLVIDEPAHVLWKAKRPLVRKLQLPAEEWIVLAIDPWQSDDARRTLTVDCGGRPVNMELRGRHAQIVHVSASGSSSRLPEKSDEAGR